MFPDWRIFALNLHSGSGGSGPKPRVPTNGTGTEQMAADSLPDPTEYFSAIGPPTGRARPEFVKFALLFAQIERMLSAGYRRDQIRTYMEAKGINIHKRTFDRYLQKLRMAPTSAKRTRRSKKEQQLAPGAPSGSKATDDSTSIHVGSTPEPTKQSMARVLPLARPTRDSPTSSGAPPNGATTSRPRVDDDVASLLAPSGRRNSKSSGEFVPRAPIPLEEL